jgi:hypothetical protein
LNFPFDWFYYLNPYPICTLDGFEVHLEMIAVLQLSTAYKMYSRMACLRFSLGPFIYLLKTSAQKSIRVYKYKLNQIYPKFFFEKKELLDSMSISDLRKDKEIKMKSPLADSIQGTPIFGGLRWFNVALRSLMEFGILAGLAYWGFQTSATLMTKILLGILMPLAVFGFWGLVDFHNAGALSEILRLVQELVISGLVAFALYLAGQPILAWTLAIISILHHVLVYLLGDTLLKRT